MQSAAAVALMLLLIFAAYTATVTDNAIQSAKSAGQPPNIAPSTWGSRPHIRHGSLGLPESTLMRYVLPVFWMTSFFQIMVHIQWLGGAAMVIDKRPVTPCLCDIDSTAGGSKRFDWVARRRRGEVCHLRLSCFSSESCSRKNIFVW